MKVLIACEFSGIVREAFRARGHDVLSCDFLPSEIPGNHWMGNVLDILAWPKVQYDLMIAFPPCTHLAASGARWWKDKRYQQGEAIHFFMNMVKANIPRIAIENPVGIMSTVFRKPDQIIQPWMFGHGETKATCLWLKDLPPLKPTCIVQGRNPRVHHEPQSKDRWKNRSRTMQGIALAMALQWGNE